MTHGFSAATVAFNCASLENFTQKETQTHDSPSFQQKKNITINIQRATIDLNEWNIIGRVCKLNCFSSEIKRILCPNSAVSLKMVHRAHPFVLTRTLSALIFIPLCFTFFLVYWCTTFRAFPPYSPKSAHFRGKSLKHRNLEISG